MPADDRLKTYAQKRHFNQTPEPSAEPAEEPEARAPIFVIQKHAASRLHYDFRLEVDGVLKSWAIPKGPSTNPKEKRLAVPTEDHPMSYARFEGTIPAGQYGGGTVIVWDIGTFQNITRRNDETIPASHALENGFLAFQLHGKKLQGEYALTRFKTGVEEAWLLVKKKDDYADANIDITKERPESALTGRTIEQVSQEE